MAISNLNNKGLNDEITFYMEIEDVADAFSDIYDLAVRKNKRKAMNICHEVMIKAGYLILRPIKPISNDSDSSITFNHIKYNFVGDWSAWIEE